MKKTKLYAKKTLSVLMAVLMLMTAWVWVAPEKAEAAGEKYYIEVVWNANRTGQKDALSDDNNDNGSCIGFFIKSKDNHGTGTEYTTTADLRGKSTSTDVKWSATVTGFPTSIIAIVDHGSIVQTAQLDIKSIKIGKDSSTLVQVFNGVITLKSSTKFKRYEYKVGNTGAGNDNDNAYLSSANGKTWAYPKVSAVVSNPSAGTVTVNKNGTSNSASFTATFKDQYGVTMAGSGATATFDPALTGPSITMSGNTATVTSGLNVFDNLSNYSTSTGKGTRTLKITNNGVVASCTVTFQAPKFNLKFQNVDGTALYNQDHYYKTAIDCASIASGLTNSVKALDSNDANCAAKHQLYVWDSDKYISDLTADTLITEIADNLADHNFDANGNGSIDADDYTIENGNHSLTCQVCGYVKTESHDNGTGYVTKVETCTENGTMTYDCKYCGKTAIATSVIDNITGHEFGGDLVMNVDGVDGNHWKKCIRFDQCGAYGWGDTLNGSEAHEWDKNNDDVVDAADGTVTKEAECLTTGIRTYYCQVAGCTAHYEEVIPATGHLNVKKTGAKNVENICGGHGYPDFWTCSDCGKIYTDSAYTTEIIKYEYTDVEGVQVPKELVVNGPDHNFAGAYVNVSNGADGTHYRQCTRFTNCGAYGLMVDGAPVVGATEKHSFTSTTVDSTCTVQGSTTYTCSGCKYSYTEKLPLEEHEMETINAVAATCTTGGNNKYYKCTECSQYFKDEAGTQKTTVEAEKTAALKHTFIAGGDVQHPETDKLVSEATCMAAAVYAVTCDRCNVESADGEYSYGDPIAHVYNGEIKSNGNKTHSFACTNDCNCGTYGVGSTKDAYVNCTYTSYSKIDTAEHKASCSCGDYITEGHTYGKWVADKTGLGTEKGTMTRTCALCSQTETTDCSYEVIGSKNASCEEEGYITYKCTDADCGHIYTETLPMLGHEWVADNETYLKSAATCEANAVYYEYCTRCQKSSETYTGKTWTKKGSKLTHDWSEWTQSIDENGVAIHTRTCSHNTTASCIEKENCSGGTANCVDMKVCTTCNTAYGEFDSTNHKSVKSIAKVPATCQTEGREAYRYCEACDKALDEIKKIDKLAHTYGEWSKLEGQDKHTRSCTKCDPDVADVATQTEDCNGGTAYCNALAVCKDCKAKYGDLNPANHSTEANTLKDVVAATCQTEGFSGNYRYDCCNAIKVAGTVTEKLAHTYNVEVEGSRIDATCIATGEVTYKCLTCDDSIEAAATKKEILPINSKNHATTETRTENFKAVNCLEDGYTGDIYYTCCYDETEGADNKKALKQKGEVVKSNGQHSYGEEAPEYLLTKDDDGNVIIVDVKNDADEVIGKAFALKDSASYDEKVAARHADGKWYHAQVCSLCSDIKYTACYTYEHTYNCSNTDKCAVCEGLCSLIDPNKHDNIVKIEEVPATHLIDGTKAYYKCADCGKYFLDEAGKKDFNPESEEGKALINISKDTVPCTDWEEIEYVAPVCGKDGRRVYKCTTEGCTKTKTETIVAENSEHEWKSEYDIVKEATCGAVGYKAIKCGLCGSVKPNSATTMPATGKHEFELKSTTPGSNCLAPTIEKYECKVCGAKDTKEVYDGETDHSWSEWITKGGDCATGVLQERECSVCKITEQQTVNTGAHSFKLEIRVEPTAEKDGYEIRKCENCGTTEREELPWNGSGDSGSGDSGSGDSGSDGLDFGNHTVDINRYTVHENATCSHGEIRRYVCLTCGETVEVETNDRENHIMLRQPAEVATCTRGGHSEYDRCAICRIEVGRTDYPALGHTDNDNNGKCDNCSSAFYTEGNVDRLCSCLCHNEGVFMQIIYKIVRFFWKLFKINPGCDCGAIHY